MSIAHPTKADLPLVRRSLAARSGRVRASRIRPAMAAGAILVSALAVLPLGFVIAVTASTDWHTIVALVVRPRVAELLVNTVLLLLLTVPIAGALAVALAWLTERSDLPGARFWSWLAVAPLAVPAFVQSYAWTGLFPSLHGLSAAVLVSVLAYFPFVYLPVSASLRRLDPALEEAAASMGLSPGRVVLRVVLPQLRLALCGGALLVGLHLLAEYGLFAMIRFDTFTTAIIDQFQSTYNGPAASMLGAVLVSCCLVLLWLETSLRGTARYAQVGSGAPRPARKTALGRWTALGMLVPLATAALTLGVPFWTLGRWLAIGGAEVWRLSEIGGALWQTVCVALVGGAVTTIAAVPMAWLAVRAPGRLQRLLEGANYVAGALPAVVIALALVAVTVRLPFYQSVVTLLLAYVLLFLPRALLSLRASIAQAPVELEQAAGLLGRSPTAALWQVTLRLAAPGAAAGTALVALGILTELTATQMLAPNGTTTLATGFWSYSAELDYASAAPYALSMVLLSLPLTVVLYRQSRRIAGR